MIQVGHDLLEIERFDRFIFSNPYKCDRLFDKREIKNNLNGAAAAFSIKEAVFKSLSNLILLSPKKIIVGYETNGRPFVEILQNYSEVFSYLFIDISLSNTQTLISTTAIAHFNLKSNTSDQ